MNHARVPQEHSVWILDPNFWLWSYLEPIDSVPIVWRGSDSHCIQVTAWYICVNADPVLVTCQEMWKDFQILSTEHMATMES